MTATIERPTRIQASRQFRMPAGTLRVTRPSPFGNPFKGPDAVGAYRIYLKWAITNGEWDEHPTEAIAALDVEVAYYPKNNHPEWLRTNLPSILQAKHIACFCALDQACHSDVLIEAAIYTQLTDT